MRDLGRFCGLGFMLVLLSACATITSGTDHQLLVETEPSGATCVLQRDGSNVGAVNPTPGAARISKSRRDLQVNCEKPGFEAAQRTIIADFQAMTIGNVLVGGVIGVAADFASGAAMTYPDAVKLVLWPRSFANATERDAFMDARRSETQADYAKRIETARGACGGASDANCERRLRELRLEEAEALRRIEEKRQSIPLGA